MSQPPTVPPFVNKLVELMLRSPLHRLFSKFTLLITFIGRKSGKTYTTPVSYSQADGQVTIFSHANWWQNLRGGAPVTLHLRGQDIQGVAEPVAEDKQAIAAALAAHLRPVPSDARYYGVTFDDQKNPRTEEVEKAAQSVIMIRIQLCETPVGVLAR